MNHSDVLSLGGVVPHRNGAYPSLPINPHYSAPQRYYPTMVKPQFVPHATSLDTILAPPSYYDISLPQTANHIRVHQLMQEMPAPEITDCKQFKATHRHNLEQINSAQRHNCDASKPTHLEPVSATHGTTRARVKRRISELNSQLQTAPRDPGSPWWDDFADNFFHSHSTISVVLPHSGRKDTIQKRFHLEKTPLAAMEFFKNLYEHQVSQVGISLNNLIVSENQWTGEIRTQAPNAVLFTEHHQPQSVKVTTEGSMSITFTPQLKIQHLEFDIKSATEFVARKNFQNLNKSGLQEMRANSTCYGIHNETIEFLKMTRVLESMQAMMAQHKSKNSIPKEIETSGTQSTQEEDTPTPHNSATKGPSSTQARNNSNQKNVKNVRKNRKRKLNSDWNRNKKTKGEESFETVARAEVEVIRHNPEMAGRVIYSMSRPCHSNSRGMYQSPTL